MVVANRLGLDKSLASRIVRTARSSDPLGALQACPSPKGLRIFLAGAEDLAPAEEVLRRTRGEVDAFEVLLGEFPSGLSELQAVLASWLPESRSATDRQARQAIFRSMSHLLGASTDVFYEARTFWPAETPGTFQYAITTARQRLRRFRHGQQLSVLSLRAHDTPANLSGTRRLDGGELGASPTSCGLPGLSSQPLPPLDVVDIGSVRVLVLPPDEPALNEPVDLAFGFWQALPVAARQSPERRYESFALSPRKAFRMLVSDVFVHDDLGWSTEPLVTARISGDITPSTPESLPYDDIDSIEQPRWIGRGIRATASRDVRDAPALASIAFEERALDPERFQHFRLVVPFPVPSVQIRTWFRLARA